jgi:hypothetical protein
MPDDADVLDQEIEDDDPEPERDRDIAGRMGSSCRKRLAEIWEDVRKGWQDQAERSNRQNDYWNIYNCRFGPEQFYNGNAQIYVPIVRNAIDARATRFVNQLFPANGRYVEAVSSDGSMPHAIVAILDHYIQKQKLKTEVFKALCRNGDVEGQYNLIVDWREIRRQVVSRETRGLRVRPGPGMPPIELPGEDVEDIAVDDIVDGYPGVEVLHDSDVLVLPATASSVDEALNSGGAVAIVRRWSKGKIKKLIADGDIRELDGERLLKEMSKAADDQMTNRHDASKELNEAVGIKAKGGHALVWETWAMLPLSKDGGYAEKGEPRLCRFYLGASTTVIGCKRNPYWNDLCPLLSAPVQKIAGVFKGEPLVAPIASMQYEANDAANKGADSATYSMLPIVAKDPEAGNGPFILNMAAIWEVDPNKVKFMEFPKLWQDAMAQVAAYKQEILQALSVSPAMMPQQTGRAGAKRNQAEIAMEQQVELLSTAEATSVLEENIATPLMGWFVDLDYQYRDADMTVRAFGEMGLRAAMEKVPPLQSRNRYLFRWWGVEQARNAAQIQQQLAFINIARGLRQDLVQEGYSLRLGPVIEVAAQAAFGARIAPLVLRDMREELSVAPDLENSLLADGYDLQVHPLDPDAEHLKLHQQAMTETGDPHGTIRVHMQRHVHAMQMKTQAQAQAQMKQMLAQQGAPGVPGAAGQPGVAGTPQPGRGGAPPRMGAQPAGPRMMKAPVGAIRPDAMPAAGAVGMPRRM